MNFYTRELLKEIGFKKIFLLVIVSVFASIFELVGIGSIGPFINLINDPTYLSESQLLTKLSNILTVKNDKNFLIYYGILVVFIFILINFYKAWLYYLQNKVALDFSAFMSCKLFEKYLGNNFNFFLARNSNELGKNIFGECQTIGNDVIRNSLVIFSQSIIASFIIILCIAINPKIGLFMIISGSFYYIIIYFFLKKWLKGLGQRQLLHDTNRLKVVIESLSSIKEIKIFKFSDRLLEFFSSETSKFTRNKIFYTMAATLPRFLIEILGVIIIVVLTVYLTTDAKLKGEALSIIAVYSFATLRLFPIFQQIYMAIAGVKSAQSRIKLVYEDLKDKNYETIISPQNQKKIIDKIEFKNLNYSYGERKFCLKDISFDIETGKIFGITGYSGSGKSTLVDIILGLLPIQSGFVKVDENMINISEYEKYQNNFSYVPQNIFIFEDTIKNNLTFSFNKKTIDQRSLDESIKISQLDDFILKQNDKIDTLIHDKGLSISGGQRQRMGIARAIYSKKKIIILDEATNSLDGNTEYDVLSGLKENLKNKMIIIVSHRKTTLKFCDKIVFMNDGKIEDTGNFESLFKSNENFKKIFNKDL